MNIEQSKSEKSGLRQLLRNVMSVPRNLVGSIFRHGSLDSPRAKSQAVFQNIFLHTHSVRTHRWTLKKSFTLGLGIASMMLFAILAVTGILLMLYYKPTVAQAYDSIKDIHYVVPGGRLMRNVHRWGGHMMIIIVLLHMMRVFWTRSYLAPRDFNWLVGIGLLVLTLALGFTGYCLPWDQLSYWAAVIGSNIAGSLRELTDALNITNYFDIGGFFRKVLLGSNEVGDTAILRFYWLHCIILPLAMAVFAAVHIWRIHKDGGMSRPKDILPEELEGIPNDEIADSSFQDEQKTYTLMCVAKGNLARKGKGTEKTVLSWPHLIKAEVTVLMLVMAALLIIGVFKDAPLREAANPLIPENPAKAPWYFLGLQELVSYSAFAGGMIIPGLVVLCLVSIPFLDRGEGISGRWPGKDERKLIIKSCVFALITTVGMLAFVVNFGWLRNWFPSIDQLCIIVFNPGTLLFSIFLLYYLFITWSTGSPRMGAVAGFSCFVISLIVLTYFGTMHRGPNWDFFWWPSQWPVH